VSVAERRLAYNSSMPNWKTFSAIAGAIILAWLVSLLYVRSGYSVDRTELETTRLRLQLVEARAQLLDARVSLYLVNFGDASGHLTFAKAALAPARATLVGRGQTELVAKLDQAIATIGTAQNQASRLSQDANSRAGEAARLLNEVIQAAPAR
jgi:hypothetical protein